MESSRYNILSLIGAAVFCCASLSAHATLQVFACEPEWAALASEVGGDKVVSFSATHAQQDPHYIRARPSLISKARRADLIICSGADLEIGWLPLLLERAGSNVQPGRLGNLMAFHYVPLLEIPVVVDRSMGDVHPDGNPHIHLDPYNILRVAEELSDRLISLDRSNSDFYKNRFLVFESKWQNAIIRWEKEAESLRGMEIVSHHKALTYLINWLHLKELGTIEPKPGLAPTASHLESILKSVASHNIRAVIRTPYENSKGSVWLSERAGVPDVVLPYTIGGDPKSGDLFALFERSIALLKNVQ